MLNSPWKVIFIYLITSLLWFLTSNGLVHLSASTIGVKEAHLHLAKDVLYVVVSSFVFFVIIRFERKSLARSLKQYRQLFFSNPNPMWIYDRETLKFVEVNNAAIRHYGYTRDQFLRKKILDIRPEEDRDKVLEAATKMPKQFNISGYWRHLKKSGEIISVFITSHGIEFNGRKSVMVMAQDVTLTIENQAELKKAYELERSLKEELENSIMLIKQSTEEKQKFAEIIERINNMVVITNPQGQITWVNSAFTNFTGYNLDEIVGKNPEILHGPKTDPKLQEKVMESLKNNVFVPFEALNYTKAGEEYWVEFNLSAIYNDKNEIERYIAIQNVITERKEKEEKIKSYTNTLRKLAWTNSHAVRKPVASILGLVDLCNHTNEIDEIKKLHALIHVCSLELDELIKEMGKEIFKYGNRRF